MEAILILAACFLAFSNGANDNFKGFATVWGSNTLSYHSALMFATLATLCGSIASFYLAQELALQFSGRGLVPDHVAAAPSFIMSVSIGAACTVFTATRLGFPVSTTHAIIGGLVGAGLGAANSELAPEKLLSTFLIPLLLSPFLAAVITWILCRTQLPSRMYDNCVCVVPTPRATIAHSNSESAELALCSIQSPKIVVASVSQCEKLSPGSARHFTARWANSLHLLSASLICFARGVNDTPKLVALLLGANILDSLVSTIAVTMVMAAGGLLFARKVAHTMSHKITSLNDQQGMRANIVTAALVLFASKLGVPVSTTHVSVGSIAGAGAATDSLNLKTVVTVVLSWIVILPVSAFLAWCVSKFL